MAYYPNNLYQNYPYSGYPQSIPTGLQGKVVDSAETARVTDVPFGSFSVFPKGDFSEIYIKTWNNNGTTQLITYKPVIEEVKKEEPNILLEKVNSIEEKMSNLLAALAPPQSAAAAQKKEVSENVKKF